MYCACVRSTITVCADGDCRGPSGRLCCSRVGPIILRTSGVCTGPSDRLLRPGASLVIGHRPHASCTGLCGSFCCGKSSSPSGRSCCSRVGPITACANGDCTGPSGRLYCSRVGLAIALTAGYFTNDDCTGPSGRLYCSRVGSPLTLAVGLLWLLKAKV